MQKYSIYLMKKEHEFESIISDLDKYSNDIITHDGMKYIYVEPKHIQSPKWLGIIPSDVLNNINKPFDYATHPKLVIYKEYRGHKFIVTLGNCKGILEIHKFEKLFGIKIAANVKMSSDGSKVKSVKSVQYGTNDLTLEQKSRASDNFSQFNLDNLSIGVKQMKITGVICGRKQTFSASSSLSLASDESLEKILEDLLHFYESNEYKQDPDMKFIDRILPIADKDIIKELNKEAFRIFIKDNDLILHWPELLNENESHYTFTKLKEQFLLIDDSVRESVVLARGWKDDDVSLGEFLKARVNLYVEGSPKRIDSKPIISCLAGEVLLYDNTYSLNNGEWYEINKDFFDEQNKLYASHDNYDEEWSQWDLEDNEAEFNNKMSNDERYILTDKILINFLENSKIEVADLISKKSDCFIHVKKFTSSATISHLTAQAKNSSRLIKTEPGMINEKLGSKGVNVQSGDNKTIVLAIASKRDPYKGTKLPYVPFFSRISINFLKNELRFGNFQLKLKRIIFSKK